MKRLSMAMTALAVMGLMTMVSCRKPNVGNVPGEARTITFNATTESGNGSKTYLDGLDVKWSADDKINVNGTEFNLVKGENTTFGSFTGTVGAVSGGYLAGYPADATNNGSHITFTIPAEQSSYNSGGEHDLERVLPMAAYTSDENADLAFKNMVNVLKLDLTGDQTITKIEVESTENLNGTFTVGESLTPTVISGSESTQKKITIGYPEGSPLDLTTNPTVYVVLPVFGSSESTVTVKFTGDDGVMTVGPKALTGSTTPNHRYDADVTVFLEWEASIVTIPVCAVHATCASSGGVVTGTGVEEQGVCWGTSANPTIAGNKYVHQYAYSLSPLKLTPKDETANNTFTGFMSGLSANTEYYVRAYIRKGSQVKYGDDEIFTTLPTEPTVDYVDLGLPSGTIWATCNLGATTPDRYGDYYMWGDNAACSTISSGTTYYVNCGWKSYRFAANSTTEFTKYCPSGKTSYWYNYSAGTNEPDGKESLGADGDHYNYADDCVRQTLGGDWRMPTEAEFNELISNTTRTWKEAGESITIGENPVTMPVAGRYCVSNITGYKDKYIFLPAAGYFGGPDLFDAGSYGLYWSSSLWTSYPHYGRYLFFASDRFGMGNFYRFFGFTVRPVRTSQK